MSNSYNVQTTAYMDVYGNTLWTEPMSAKRLWKVGQTFIEDYIQYRIVRMAVSGNTQVVNIEVV